MVSPVLWIPPRVPELGTVKVRGSGTDVCADCGAVQADRPSGPKARIWIHRVVPEERPEIVYWDVLTVTVVARREAARTCG